MKTAVEWLYEILHKQNYIYEDMSEYLKQAKEMEKQHIIDAYYTGNGDVKDNQYKEAKQYYNVTFKK